MTAPNAASINQNSEGSGIGETRTTEPISSSPPSPSSRKRPRETTAIGSAPGSSSMSEDNGRIENGTVRGLRLEAIFHPKFDNERKRSNTNKKSHGNNNTKQSGDIRSTMLAKLNGNNDRCGHLEVSLKHSGSLVLWSGSTRFYSKNSACNQFTRTAEILLRQRFETVRRALAATKAATTTNTSRPFHSYEDCSRFVSEHRYTVAFEVVTAEMLGDHGQIPNRDYVVVTAVADRGREGFLSTVQVLEFCQKFRLPHNDIWAFCPDNSNSSSSRSAKSLFCLYDESLRETGDTETTVTELTKIADVAIPSPIPHSVFQGTICEGFIVRYVELTPGESGGRQTLEELSRVAKEILDEIPPTFSLVEPTTTTTDTPNIDSVANIDLRELYRSTANYSNDNDGSDEKGSLSSSPFDVQRQRGVLFSEKLRTLLSTDDNNNDEDDATKQCRDSTCSDDDDSQTKRRRKIRPRNDLKKIKPVEDTNGGAGGAGGAGGENSLRHHLPTLTKHLVDSSDRETKRIATLLQTLDGLKGGAVTYTFMEKHEDSEDSVGKALRRLYCIIHVHNDSTFFKIQSLQGSDDMTLFRGFCVELLLDGHSPVETETVLPIVGATHLCLQDDRTTSTRNDGAPLMLKMKLLPYMVRTFVCRNLLRTIEQKGAAEFERIALGLLEKWNTSPEAQERWMPFFRGWALYVLQYKQENSGAVEKPTGALELGPLTNASYLRHLEHYTKRFHAGDFEGLLSSAKSQCSAAPESHILLCFVSHSTEVGKAAAIHFAKEFSERNCGNPETGAVVCSLGEAARDRRTKSCFAYSNTCNLTKGIKKFVGDKKMAKQMILVLLASDKEDIIAMTRSPASDGASTPSSWMEIANSGDGKKLTNMWKPWKKIPCARRFIVPLSAIGFGPNGEDATIPTVSRFDSTNSIADAIQEIGTSLFEQAMKKDSDPSMGGILVFFPGIPGCGKSSLLRSMETKLRELSFHATGESDICDREVHVKEGDKCGKHFWNIIEDLLSDENDRRKKSPTLVIADKNAPPASWSKLGQIRTESNGILLPALPDRTVLETTTIQGSILPDGKSLPHASHFYPFSLKFLAVSLSRVLNRPPGEHVGKLDSGFPMACMVVVQFYAFYRYITADGFLEKMEEKCFEDGHSLERILKPIELPFLTESARTQELPDDLNQLLIEALQLRHGHDKNKRFKVKAGDKQMIDLEQRLRSSIDSHNEVIRSMTVSLEDSQKQFALQIMDRMKVSPGAAVSATTKDSNVTEKDDDERLIKLVSLDIDRNQIHNILKKHQESGALANFFENVPTPNNFAAPSFVVKTHVTMAFAGERNSVETLLSKYSHLQGREVYVTVTGFWWSSTNGAFSVDMSSSTIGDDPMPFPSCENSFPHITVWCEMEAKEFWSNRLPAQVESGEAFHIDFESRDKLVGKLSFWSQDNEPIEIKLGHSSK